MTRRFDRHTDGSKRHIQTLCGIAHLDFNLADTHDYAQYLQVIDELDVGAAAREQAFRRIVFNVSGVNRDDHTKNLSFLMEPDGSWQLAPAYDVTHAFNPGRTLDPAPPDVGRRPVRQPQSCGPADARGLVRRPGPADVIADVLAAVDRWTEFAGAADLPGTDATRIAEDHARFRPR